MKILAFDTTMDVCSAALLRDDVVLAHRAEELRRGHAEALMPMIEGVLSSAAQAYTDLDLIAVTVGPGSFTGQRVGVAAARGLGLALSLPVQGVTTLEVMAFQARHDNRSAGNEAVVGVLDAGRGQLYLQVFQAPEVWPETRSTPLVTKPADAPSHIPGGPLLLAGSGSELALAELTAARVDVQATACDLSPDAVFAAQLAARHVVAKGLPTAPPSPLYLRAPDAKLPPPPTA